MKLPIKNKYFEQIKAGQKSMEIRDAHITFINEKTKEELRKDVRRVEVCSKSVAMQIAGMVDTKEAEELFTDSTQMIFYLD